MTSGAIFVYEQPGFFHIRFHSIEHPASDNNNKMNTTKAFPSYQFHYEPWLDMSRYPTTFDIISLKRFLSQTLPTKVIDMILSLAEYWPHSSCSSASPIKAQGKVAQDALPAHWCKHRRPEATTPLSFTDSSEDGFVLRSPPIGIPHTDVVPFQALLVPRAPRPVRMIVFEIRYYRLFHTKPESRRPQVVRPSSTCLEVGIKKPLPPTESPARAILEPATPPIAQVLKGSPQLRRICDRVYRLWDLKRSFCDPAHTKIDLYMDHQALADNMLGQKTVVWRFDDDVVAEAKVLDDGWGRSEETGRHLWLFSEADKAQLDDFVHSLAKTDREEKADFVKQLEVGDSLGVWVRVRDGPSVSMVDGVRMHVFWAAS
ncbi:MAG: hypothetical protein ASARMPREDX12_002957 [Alectoria sarmentosa]|nr:MAG: hypothetical protein ASARMPREDX12_002957 [Alectoria sarmentosa]